MDIRDARRGTLALLIHKENENTRAKENDGMQGIGPDASALISKQSGSVPQKSLMTVDGSTTDPRSVRTNSQCPIRPAETRISDSSETEAVGLSCVHTKFGGPGPQIVAMKQQ